MLPDEELPLTKEEIELKLSKIDLLETKVAQHDVEIEVLKKRIKRLQDQKEEKENANKQRIRM